MILYKNIRAMVRSPNDDSELFDNIALAPYIFIMSLGYVLRSLIKENGFTFKKTRSRRYPAEIITDAGYRDDLALFTNAPTPVESRLHSLEQAARGTGL